MKIVKTDPTGQTIRFSKQEIASIRNQWLIFPDTDHNICEDLRELFGGRGIRAMQIREEMHGE